MTCDTEIGAAGAPSPIASYLMLHLTLCGLPTLATVSSILRVCVCVCVCLSVWGGGGLRRVRPHELVQDGLVQGLV